MTRGRKARIAAELEVLKAVMQECSPKARPARPALSPQSGLVAPFRRHLCAQTGVYREPHLPSHRHLVRNRRPSLICAHSSNHRAPQAKSVRNAVSGRAKRDHPWTEIQLSVEAESSDREVNTTNAIVQFFFVEPGTRLPFQLYFLKHRERCNTLVYFPMFGVLEIEGLWYILLGVLES